MLLSFLIPIIKIEPFQAAVAKQNLVLLPEVLIGNKTPIILNEVLLESNQVVGFSWSWSYLFVLGSSIMLLIFLGKLFKIIALYRQGIKQKVNNITIVKLNHSNAAFSFFNIIFIGDLVELQERESILQHELIHVKQRHSLDMVFFEILKIGLWFNPMVYIYQQRISNIHEFIADKEIANHEGKKQYYLNLLSKIFDTKKIAFINTFFKQSLIKKRIVMLQKSKSKQIKLVKYALLLPVIFSMLVYSSCSNENLNNQKHNQEVSIMENIDALKESIAAKGEMTPEEEKAFKALVVLISDEGLNHDYYEEVSDVVEIPFGIVENVPVYPGCESLESKNEVIKCMHQNITKFVGDNFNTKVSKGLGLEGNQRIMVTFKIDTQGNVTAVKARAAHKALQEEAERVVSLLPKMKPGEQKGKKVTVPYALPIMFALDE
ncbi:M56 family metallopeptidase [Mangrovimonas cancribranchiae]|uniref:M56 family metallopeptidase n=1 Tax=Mangrovimonas cancribranchiae TaxID=3080055 RepID=A0AAU6P2C1_9FLAO